MTLPAPNADAIAALSATVPAPEAGTPACPVTVTVAVWPPPTVTRATRSPVSGLNAPAAAGVPASQYPSASRLTVTWWPADQRTARRGRRDRPARTPQPHINPTP